MSVTAVVGAQWGDEGKGRVVDYLAQHADWVIRFQGGDNAGHTVVNNYGRFALHMIPSGIFNPKTTSLIGPGTVVNMDSVINEMAALHEAGVQTGTLLIDQRAHLVMPYHLALDGAEEASRHGDWKIGTTKRGIGPCYADKYGRSGIRAGELLYPDRLRARLEEILPRKNRELEYFGLPPVDLDELLERCATWREKLGELIIDSHPLLREAIHRDEMILLEGQLGVMRGIDWGCYPFVTSSSPTSGGACIGAGIPPQAINDVLGVVKAYSTAVGAGPFPTEQRNEIGDRLREIGHEFGATTGRPRRCGWLDGVALAYASWLNGFTGIAITKLDVLDTFETIRIATAYRLGDKILTEVPDTPTQELVEPIYEEWPGWQRPIGDARHWDDLPPEAQQYIRRIEEIVGAPVRYISVGPERDQMIVME